MTRTSRVVSLEDDRSVMLAMRPNTSMYQRRISGHFPDGQTHALSQLSFHTPLALRRSENSATDNIFERPIQLASTANRPSQRLWHAGSEASPSYQRRISGHFPDGQTHALSQQHERHHGPRSIGGAFILSRRYDVREGSCRTTFSEREPQIGSVSWSRTYRCER